MQGTPMTGDALVERGTSDLTVHLLQLEADQGLKNKNPNADLQRTEQAKTAESNLVRDFSPINGQSELHVTISECNIPFRRKYLRVDEKKMC